jgi:hypothetical protein
LSRIKTTHQGKLLPGDAESVFRLSPALAIRLEAVRILSISYVLLGELLVELGFGELTCLWTAAS